MKRLGWYALRVTVAAFVLCGGLLLAANLYVQSRSVQQRIRTELATLLKMPVSLRKTTVTPWDGVRLDGVVLHANGADPSADGSHENGPELLNAASFRVKFAWWPLLVQKRLNIEQVLLDKPLVTLREGLNPWPEPQSETVREGSDQPTPPPVTGPWTGQPPAAPGGSPQVAAGTPAPTAPANQNAPEPTPRPTLVKNLPLLVDRLRLRHGKLVYLDHERHPVAQIEDINLDGATSDPQHAHGALWFARAGDGRGGAVLTNYWTAVDFDTEKGLAVRDGRGDLAGGVLNTNFRLEPREDRLAYTTTASLKNVAIGQLARPAADQPPVAEGQLHGHLDLSGFLDDPASRTGGGRLWVEGGKMHNLPLLNLAGQVLKIADLSHLDFKQAQMDYKLEGTTLRIDPLTLVTNDVQIIVRGSYLTAEDRLDLHGRLMIDQAVSHQLPQFIESNFTPCGSEAPGSRYLDFDITGPMEDPKSNLYERLMAGPMKGLLDNLMAPKSKNPKNQRRDSSKKAKPAPEATPKP